MPGPSFGVEEEFILVDPLTGAPAPRNREVAHRATRRGVELQLEFTSCQVEATTDKTESSHALHQQLSQHRAAAAQAAREAGLLLIAAGLPPVVGTGMPITASPRYLRMAEHLGMIADERGNCGCHVHVEVPSRDAAVAVSNWLRPWLPVMLALTANSAIYRGLDTGHASWRHMVWGRWPSAGPPPYFASVLHYDRAVTMLLDSGAILDTGMIYWDIRPSVRFPTVEVRIADVPATAAETVLYATLVRAAVMTALAAEERGEQAPAVPDHAVRIACWKAAHDGLSGCAVDIAGGGSSVPAARTLGRWLRLLDPALEELGDADWVHNEVHRLLRFGNGAALQRRAWAGRARAADVVAAAAAATVS